MIKHLALVPVIAAAAFLLVTMSDSVSGLAVAALLGTGIAAVMVTIVTLVNRAIFPMVKEKLANLHGLERQNASMIAAMPSYFLALFLPIGALFLVKPYLPECPLIIAYLIAMALSGLAVSRGPALMSRLKLAR